MALGTRQFCNTISNIEIVNNFECATKLFSDLTKTDNKLTLDSK